MLVAYSSAGRKCKLPMRFVEVLADVLPGKTLRPALPRGRLLHPGRDPVPLRRRGLPPGPLVVKPGTTPGEALTQELIRQAPPPRPPRARGEEVIYSRRSNASSTFSVRFGCHGELPPADKLRM